MYAGLYVGALLSTTPLILTTRAVQSTKAVSCSAVRTIAFRVGLITSLFCAAASVCCWLDPFPLISDGRGGYSNIILTLLCNFALATAGLTFFFALFGRRSPRLFLCVAAVIQFVITYLAVLQNGV